MFAAHLGSFRQNATVSFPYGRRDKTDLLKCWLPLLSACGRPLAGVGRITWVCDTGDLGTARTCSEWPLSLSHIPGASNAGTMVAVPLGSFRQNVTVFPVWYDWVSTLGSSLSALRPAASWCRVFGGQLRPLPHWFDSGWWDDRVRRQYCGQAVGVVALWSFPKTRARSKGILFHVSLEKPIDLW